MLCGAEIKIFLNQNVDQKTGANRANDNTHFGNRRNIVQQACSSRSGRVAHRDNLTGNDHVVSHEKDTNGREESSQHNSEGCSC